MSQDTSTHNANTQESLQSLIEENIAISEKIFKQNKKIIRHMRWQTAGGYLRLLLIVVPIILAAIYLPPILKPYMEQMRDLLETSGSVNSRMNSHEVQEFLKQWGR